MIFLKRTLILIFAALISCQNSKSGNTVAGNPYISLAMTGASTNATVLNIQKRFNFFDLIFAKSFAFPAPSSMMDSAGNVVVLSQYWINLGSFEFEATESATLDEIDGTNIDFQGPYPVNLLTSSPQILGSNSINLSQIRRIKAKLAMTLSVPTGAPSVFLGKSIYISGQVNGNNFTFSTNAESEVQVGGATVITALSDKTMLLELRTANLIKKMNLSAITTATNIDDSNKVNVVSPCSGIDVSANDLFSCFLKGLETESDLGRDDDGNFRIDATEEAIK